MTCSVEFAEILPHYNLSSAYHQKCIDPWLTKNKKTCPICKRKVIPGRDEDSSDSEDNSDDDGDHRNSETQPLLPAQDLHRMPYRSGAGTFENSGTESMSQLLCVMILCN